MGQGRHGEGDAGADRLAGIAAVIRFQGTEGCNLRKRGVEMFDAFHDQERCRQGIRVAHRLPSLRRSRIREEVLQLEQELSPRWGSASIQWTSVCSGPPARLSGWPISRAEGFAITRVPVLGFLLGQVMAGRGAIFDEVGGSLADGRSYAPNGLWRPRGLSWGSVEGGCYPLIGPT
jgi:hypothetical protein